MLKDRHEKNLTSVMKVTVELETCGWCHRRYTVPESNLTRLETSCGQRVDEPHLSRPPQWL